MIVAPFFVLGWTAPRWPRITGALLLLVSAAFLAVFAPTGSLGLATELLTAALLIIPMVACGIALIRVDAWKDTEQRDISENRFE
jgi:hypothetical protein